jgi:hypothetical protein
MQTLPHAANLLQDMHLCTHVNPSSDWAKLHLLYALCAAVVVFVPAGDAQGVPDAVHRHRQPQAHQRTGTQQQVPQGGSNHQAGK